MHETDPNKQNIARCIELADHRLTNDGTKEALWTQVDAVLASLKNKTQA